MTDTPQDNLPATRTDGFGPHDTPLSEAPTAALAFALGYAAARPQSANDFGPFCAMVEELMARPTGRPAGPLGGWDQRSEFGIVMSLLPAHLSRAIVMLYQAQRGQRWARTGQSRLGR
ncbi:hypothetical protein I5G59_gp62 [Mycobacterium phage LilMcDreamy]|uniref:DUF7423 domain-containing protein n=1 Tax=Mycobacterium phage LilMcDreamy TaxID=2652422 RepID=A0A5P8D8C1_9CAUD|nr:hypothetical protein I5G59_gp62 [Mycobacterium phage LilMcDreamy]QFP94682.1 hypothetical protein SEA_LILMCDREAMY_62 [Mycobacterium phage LilMcDreamy]